MMTQLEQSFYESATKYCREHSTDCNYNKQIDWEQRRYEIAKDILAALISNPNHCGKSYESEVKHAVEFADALIDELKK